MFVCVRRMTGSPHISIPPCSSRALYRLQASYVDILSLIAIWGLIEYT